VQIRIRINLLKSLAAVLLGNLIYFTVLAKRLPPSGRHQPFRLDAGLLVDAWICLLCYGLIELFIRWGKSRGKAD